MFTQSRTVTTLSFFSFQRILAPILLLFLWSFTGCRPSQTQTQPLDEEFDAYVEKTLRDWKAPGVMISVVKNGKHVFAKGYGTRKFGENLPINENTLVQIASHTKPITAAALAMLVDEGKLSWDDPVKKHIPEFQLSNPYATEKTTIRDLLTHRAGFPGVLGGFNNPDYSFNDLLRDLQTRKPVTGFRERHSYSNVGFAIAGEVVARVSGMSWEDFVTQRILQPLGMSSSYASTNRLWNDLGDPNNVENIFIPARKNDGVVTLGDWSECSCGYIYAPAGGVITTAVDIAKWMIMQLQEGEYNGKRVISAKAIREMHTPQTIVAPFWGRSHINWADLHNPLAHFITYGLGWISFDYRGRKIDEHPGGWMSSFVTVVPEENLGVAVCTNAYYSDPDSWESLRMVSALKLKVVDLFLGAPETDWSAEFLRIHQEEAARQAK